MAREKFGWEREDQFDVKRLKLAESMIEPKHAGVVIVGGLAFLFLVFFVSPSLVFGPPAGLVTLLPLMAVFGAIALVNTKMLRIKDDVDDADDRAAIRDTGPGDAEESGTEEES